MSERGTEGTHGEAIGEVSLRSLIEALRSGHKDDRQRAAELLARCGPGAVTGLMELAEVCGPQVRVRIAWIAGQMDSPESFDLLRKLAADADTSVRRQAFDSLVRKMSGDPPPEASHELLLSALEDSDDRVRLWAAEELGQRRDIRAVAPLLKALSDRDVAVREAAVTALGFQGDARAVPELTNALWSHTNAVRHAAAEALGAIGSGLAISGLISVIKSPDDVLADKAAAALASIGPTSAPALAELLQDDEARLRGHAARALGEIGIASVPYLCDALRDRSAAVRRAAAGALQHVARTDPGPELLEAIPLLRRMRQGWTMVGLAPLELYRETLALLEEVTAAMKDLPLPAAAPPESTVALPIPSASSITDARELPVPSDAGEPPDPPEPPRTGRMERMFDSDQSD